MVLYVVFTDSARTKYKTSICSKATLVIFFINLLVFIVPFLVAYRSQGFWLKNSSYREQPDVHFMYEYFLLFETDNIETPVVCTTFPAITDATLEFNKCPYIKVREEDFNKDGKYDKLYFEAEALLSEAESVFSVTVILLFDYKLYSHSAFQMQSLGWVETSSGVGGSRLKVSGDLKLEQRSLLRHRGKDTRFNTSVVTANYSHEFNLFSLLSSYSDRNVTTRMTNLYTVWSRGRDPTVPFKLNLVVGYPEDVVLYRPGPWQVIKQAWIQYLALLYISFLLGRRTKHFILNNRLVHNIKVEPWKGSL